MSDIVAKLRRITASGRANHLSKADRLRIADRIEALEAENARLKEAERTAWERGLDKAWRSIKGQIGKDLKAYDCKDAGEGYDLAINDAVETIQSLTPEASHD